jgi:GntR family transcriptional regulator
VVDGKGNMLYAGVTWYRGDGHISEIVIHACALKTVPGITEPQWRAANGLQVRLKALIQSLG